MIDVTAELRRLTALGLSALQAEYAGRWGEPARSNNRTFLIKRIVWRAQAQEQGDLSDRARQLAQTLARDEDLRVRPGAAVHAAFAQVSGAAAPSTRSLPAPGAILARDYRGRRVEVRVLERGFEWQGTVYRSLTAVARAVTGSAWNGRLFFGLSNPEVSV